MKRVAALEQAFCAIGFLDGRLNIERVDAFNDLALLTSTAELVLKPLKIADASPAPGTTVYAIGNPAGLERSISSGIVSGVRELNGRNLLQITAPISPGSSGGPVLNRAGEVVGVAVGMLEKGQNLNFAVPATLVLDLMAGKKQASTDVLSLIEAADALTQKRAKACSQRRTARSQTS